MDLAPLDDREVPQNVDECLADAFASVHYAENRLIDAQASLEKVLQHRGAHPRVLRRAQPYESAEASDTGYPCISGGHANRKIKSREDGC